MISQRVGEFCSGTEGNFIFTLSKLPLLNDLTGAHDFISSGVIHIIKIWL